MCADPECKESVLLDNVCTQIHIYIHTDLHTSACFLLKIALRKHTSAKEPHADLGFGDDICMEKKSLGWIMPMLSRGTTFGASCCLLVWSLEHGEGHLQKRRLLEGEKGPWGKFCSHSYAAARDCAAARDSPGLWAPDGALSSWIILLSGLGRRIQRKIRTDSKLCLHSLLSLILHIAEDEQTPQGYR